MAESRNGSKVTTPEEGNTNNTNINSQSRSRRNRCKSWNGNNR